MAISASELVIYRGMLEDVLLATDTCTLQTRTWNADSIGGGSYTWAAAATDVPCRLVPAGLQQREGITAEQLMVHDLFTLSLHWDRAITEEMRVVIGSDTFEVVHVDDSHTQRLTRSAQIVRAR